MRTITIDVDTDNDADVDQLKKVLEYVLGLSTFTYSFTTLKVERNAEELTNRWASTYFATRHSDQWKDGYRRAGRDLDRGHP